MLITKCDICKKEIKEKIVFASIGRYFAHQSFCSKCGKPVVDFLKKVETKKRVNTESK
ncbi:MAG: hypothetical protein HYT67_02065 [Candidatus Yanofskybacteria bacterium]|nr:hypothetical protein [Candidatus Yanofskybacteria bacterium]